MDWLFNIGWVALGAIVTGFIARKWGMGNLKTRLDKTVSVLKYGRNALGHAIDWFEGRSADIADGKLDGEELKRAVQEGAEKFKLIRQGTIIDDTLATEGK